MAELPYSPFLPIHFVKAGIKVPDQPGTFNGKLEDRDVILSKQDPTLPGFDNKFVSGKTDINGMVILNAWRLKYLAGEMTTAGPFYLSVNKGPDNYGCAPQQVVLDFTGNNGYFIAPSMTLGFDQGPNLKALTITQPLAGSIWEINKAYDITWTTVGQVPNVKVEFTLDDTATWVTVSETTANTGTYSWGTPGTISDLVRVKVSDQGDNTIFSQSGLFSLVKPLLAPTGLSVTNVTKNSALLNWSGVSGAVSYVIGYNVSGGKEVEITGITDTSFNLTKLTPDTNYECRVRAIAGQVSSPWSETKPFKTNLEVPIPPGATKINAQVLFSGFFPTPSTPTMQWTKPETQPTVVFELRESATGLPAGATQLVAVSEAVQLNADGTGTVWFKPDVFGITEDGVQHGEQGNYFIVVLQKINNTKVPVENGYNHIPVISEVALPFTPGNTYSLNFADPDSEDFLPVYTPTGLVAGTIKSTGLIAVLPGHVATGIWQVDNRDLNIVLKQIQVALAKSNQHVDPNNLESVLSDINGDDIVDNRDYNLALKTVVTFGPQAEKHIYVPALLP